MSSCLVCTEQSAESLPVDSDSVHQKCARCGEFRISGSAAVTVKGDGTDEALRRAKLSGWIHDQNRAGALPVITTQNIERIVARPLPTVAERATRLLAEAAHGLTNLTVRFDINQPRFMAATYSADREDLYVLMRLLANHGLIEHEAIGGIADISPAGLLQLDQLKQKATGSSQGFVAMWFTDDLNAIYAKGFQKGIFEAGYDPLRIDRIEHVNRIDDEIILQIRRSRFVVADFTGHRGGVYFEAGFALGMDLPVFWTCRKDDLDKLHFDIRQFNCIDWETPEELSERLAKRIEAVLGHGPNRLP